MRALCKRTKCGHVCSTGFRCEQEKHGRATGGELPSKNMLTVPSRCPSKHTQTQVAKSICSPKEC